MHGWPIYFDNLPFCKWWFWIENSLSLPEGIWCFLLGLWIKIYFSFFACGLEYTENARNGSRSIKIGNQVQDDADLMIFKWIYWELNLRDIALNVGFLPGLELHGATHLGLSPPPKKTTGWNYCSATKLGAQHGETNWSMGWLNTWPLQHPKLSQDPTVLHILFFYNKLLI